MSNPINTNIKPYQQSLTGLNQQLPVDSEKLKQGVNQIVSSNPALKPATSYNDYLYTAAATIPVWLGVSKLVDKFDKACANTKDGSKTVLQKIGDFGDKISGSKVFTNPVAKKIGKFCTDAKKFVITNIINKSAILRSMAYTPSVPTCKAVTSMLNGPISETASNAVAMMQKYTNEGKDLEKVAEFGFKDYASVIKKPEEHIKEIMKAFSKKEGFVDLTKQGFGQPVRNFLGKKAYWSEIYNKMDVLKKEAKNIAKPGLGKALQKGALKTIGLITGGNSGKGGLLFQSAFIAYALVKGLQAPKGEKGKSTAENLVSNLGWYLTMPIGIMLMHRVGGLQYIGMSPARLRKFRQAKTAFDAKANAGGFANEAEQKVAAKLLKAMKNGKDAAKRIVEVKKAGHILKGSKVVSWYHKPFVKLADILTVGLEGLRGFKSLKAGFWPKVGNVFRNRNFNMKNWAGYPLRFGIFMFAISPFLDNGLIKGCHAIFGRPTKSVLDKEPEKAPQTAVPGQAAPTTNGAVPQPTVQTVVPVPAKVPTVALAPVKPPVQVPIQSQSGGSLLNTYKLNPQAQTNVASQPVAPAQPKPQEPVRTYVPSSAGVQIQGQPKDVSDKANAAMNKADAAEKEALKFLVGK